jgi:hypothetical protein
MQQELPDALIDNCNRLLHPTKQSAGRDEIRISRFCQRDSSRRLKRQLSATDIVQKQQTIAFNNQQKNVPPFIPTQLKAFFATNWQTTNYPMPENNKKFVNFYTFYSKLLNI